MPTDLDTWFVREVLVHERALVLFLQRAWPHRDEWHDLRQEAYARVYEAAARTRTRPDTPKAFLLTTARHLITDRLRRSRVVSIDNVGDMESLNVLVDEVSPERWSSGRQTLKRLAEAFDRLPDRCRQVVWLRRVEELPQKEVAMRMGITEKTVEKQLSKGVRLIAGYFHMDEPVAAKQLQEPAPAGNGQAHGQQPAD